MKETIVDFLNSTEDSLELDGHAFSSEEAEKILMELGFEYGEEQDSDGVRYSQFYHDAFDSITIKQALNRCNYEIIRE